MKEILDYAIAETKKVLSIDSPTGFTREAAEYVAAQYRALGFDPIFTRKGCVLVCVNNTASLRNGGGESPLTNTAYGGNGGEAACTDGAVLLAAHLDTLGAMVRDVTPDGRLLLSNIGGLNPNNVETENCRVRTRGGKVFTGVCQLHNASTHVNGEYGSTARSFDTVEVLLDEEVSDRAGVAALGIGRGDFVCFDPRTVVTESGYIKSRFLDDKLSVGILLGHAKYLAGLSERPARKIYHYITVFEEVGHGGCASIPDDVDELISVDMGCVGDGLGCRETDVSICAKDSAGPYHYDVTNGLIDAARRAGADYAVDVYPHYSSDVEASLRAGADCRHGLIGAGVYASHGYERSHVKGVENALKLLIEYIK